ncbi:hypothetical protein L4C36_00125 [Photobacterium japonica]|uniref:hypothetical protein n=1 Tax=Photobacterium japonica TaxID=2910235 RepID=UPI003D12E5E4
MTVLTLTAEPCCVPRTRIFHASSDMHFFPSDGVAHNATPLILLVLVLVLVLAA